MLCNFLEECHLSSLLCLLIMCGYSCSTWWLDFTHAPSQGKDSDKRQSCVHPSSESQRVREQCVFLWPCALADDRGWETAGKWLGDSQHVRQYLSHGASFLTCPQDRGCHHLAPRSNVPTNWKNSLELHFRCLLLVVWNYWASNSRFFMVLLNNAY